MASKSNHLDSTPLSTTYSPPSGGSIKTNNGTKQAQPLTSKSKRLNYISQNYEEFRQFVHKVREQVELGKNMYNSILGPTGYLNVDSNKDICVSGILIGGRCKNDLYESKLRHEFETVMSSKIKIESWDSWLKKLTRE